MGPRCCGRSSAPGSLSLLLLLLPLLVSHSINSNHLSGAQTAPAVGLGLFLRWGRDSFQSRRPVKLAGRLGALGAPAYGKPLLHLILCSISVRFLISWFVSPPPHYQEASLFSVCSPKAHKIIFLWVIHCLSNCWVIQTGKLFPGVGHAVLLHCAFCPCELTCPSFAIPFN